MRRFSELEMDALTEAFNLSLGEAAATFSAIVREEIELSVPTIEILSRDQLTGLGLAADVRYVANRAAKDTVVRQNPEGGAQASNGCWGNSNT